MTSLRREHAGVLRTLLPWLWAFRGRAALALCFLGLAKGATVALPWLLKQLVDGLNASKGAALALPLGLLLGYGALRLSTSLFGELRDIVFARANQRAVRRISLSVFRHLHKLDLAFHLERQTGGLSRDIERGASGISFLLSFMLFNVIPTLLEIGLVTAIFLWFYDVNFALVILAAVTLYILFSLLVTEWRMQFVRRVNELDSSANTRAIDSLLNYETVKYFGNEEWEASRYDAEMERWEDARVRNQMSLASLNAGQSLIIAGAVTTMMILAARGVVDGDMTIGDLVMVNAYMLQLFLPLNFLGFVYREIKRSLGDMERMFALLDQSPGVTDRPGAGELVVRRGQVRFENVAFGYRPDRPIIRDVSFDILGGRKLAVVGPSGAGKSTLARLLFRFYDVTGGRILVDGLDIRDVSQDSLRRQIGIVPQDTVLFNDTIGYNIAYGHPGASDEDVRHAARLAHLDGFIGSLPEGYETRVGERGLKLSGGEKQRVAIARTMLKNPPVLVFDEATSSLDSHAEQRILETLREIAADRTTLVIAHRLSTVVDADQIVVLDQGRVVERGTHAELLAAGERYAAMWRLQQDSSALPEPTSPVRAAHDSEPRRG